MGFILLEGLDRSGKSTVANYYKDKGYEVVHMGAPDKKYFSESYSGESYLEELVRMYTAYEGKDVVFDRTVYGELIWPNVFGRNPLLSPEDFEYLYQIESNNGAERILMQDPDTDAHWQRCVDSGEPLNRNQFGRANVFYERLVSDYGFKKKQLSDFVEVDDDKSETKTTDESKSVSEDIVASTEDKPTSSSNDSTADIENKLEKANAIRSLLKSKIIKKKGQVYEKLESDIRDFLSNELDSIFKEQKSEEEFTEEEVEILKVYAQRIKEKMGTA